MELTQEYLKLILHYDPDTGIFTWLSPRVLRIKKGNVAGVAEASGYIRVQIKGKNYSMHRLAFLYMTGAFPAEHTDHINRNRSDNRWLNLRAVSNSVNQKNAKKRSDNKSRITGVHWDARSKKWCSKIKVGKSIFIGLFEDFFEAVCARKSAEVLYGFHPNHGRVQ